MAHATALTAEPLALHDPVLAARFVAEPRLLDRAGVLAALGFVDDCATLAPEFAHAALIGADGDFGGLARTIIRRAASRAHALTADGRALAAWAAGTRAEEADFAARHPEFVGLRDGLSVAVTA